MLYVEVPKFGATELAFEVGTYSFSPSLPSSSTLFPFIKAHAELRAKDDQPLITKVSIMSIRRLAKMANIRAT